MGKRIGLACQWPARCFMDCLSYQACLRWPPPAPTSRVSHCRLIEEKGVIGPSDASSWMSHDLKIQFECQVPLVWWSERTRSLRPHPATPGPRSDPLSTAMLRAGLRRAGRSCRAAAARCAFPNVLKVKQSAPNGPNGEIGHNARFMCLRPFMGRQSAAVPSSRAAGTWGSLVPSAAYTGRKRCQVQIGFAQLTLPSKR